MNRHNTTSPPEIRGLPFLGSTLELLDRPIQFFVNAAAEEGEIFRMKLPTGHVTVVSGSQSRQVLKEESDALTRQNLFSTFATEMGLSIFSSEGEEHERLRSALRLGFSRQIAGPFAARIARRTSARARDLYVGDQRSALTLFSEEAARAFLTVLTPREMAEHIPALRTYGERVMQVATGLRPSLSLLDPRYRAARREVQAAMRETAEDHRDGRHRRGADLFALDVLLGLGENEDPEALPRAVGAALYGAAGSAIYIGRLASFVLYELLRRPSLLGRVQEEVDAAWYDGPPTAAILRRMATLRACYLEALRFYPLVPGLFFRTRRPLQIAGYGIGVDEPLLLSWIPSHFSSEAYQDPFLFEPSRCAHPRHEHRAAGAFCPFGVAPRSCVAMGMSEVILMSVLAGLLRSLELRLPNPSYRMELSLNPLLGPRKGLPVTVAKIRSSDRRAKGPLPAAGSLLTLDLEPREELETALLDKAVITTWKKGEPIFGRGEVADRVYVVLHGEIVLHPEEPSSDPARGSSEGDETILRRGHFGSHDLLREQPRERSAVALTEAKLLSIDGAAFRGLLESSSALAEELAESFHRRFVERSIQSGLPAVDAATLERLAEEFTVERLKPDELLIREGTPSDALYFLVEGQLLTFTRTEEGGEKRVRMLAAGDVVGEIGILLNRPRTASVRALTPATLLSLRGEALDRLLEGSRADLALLMGARLMQTLSISGEDSA